MKNLFKNLMLVAVAAMAFVACSEVSVEVDNLVKKTVINGTASINTDDTRSGFVGSETNENGTTVYKSAWDGDENIKVFAIEQGLETTAIINADGKFTAEFDGELPTNYYITLCSPAEAWGSTNTFTIPTVQTPRTNSVDPAAHILQCQNAMVTNGTVNAKMQHEVGYGKMTVNTPAEFVIDYVEVELNGDWYGARTLKYTINADNVEGNVFWFATDVVEVSDFTVTAYDAKGNAYTKSVTIPDGRELKFQFGRVSTFSVSNLKEYVEPAFTSENTMSYDSSSWNYVDEVINYSDVLMIFSSEELGTLQLNFYNAFDGNYITPGTFYLGDLIYTNSGTQYSYYMPAGSETKYQLNGGSVIVSVTEDKKYHFEFKDITYNGTNTLNSTYTGDIDGFGMPDTREKLPTPEVNTPTVNGKEITLTWSDVNDADGYYVYCIQDSTINTTTKEHTATFTMPSYGTPYTFMIKAIANDDNPTYRSSDETYFTTVSTGSDPNKFADYMATNIAWNQSNTCFDISVDGVDGARIQVNAANRANNNSLTLGDYSYGTGEMQFRFASTGWSYSEYQNISMNVSIVDGQYRILITVGSDGWSSNFEGSIGYLGMPNGWVAPGGSEEPEQPELTALATPELAVTVSGNTVTATWNDVTGAANYTVTLNGENKGTTTETSISFSDLKYSTDYTITVVANPADSTTNTVSEAASESVTIEADPNAGGGDEPENPGDNEEEWVGREVKLMLLAYQDNTIYSRVNNESIYIMTNFRNGITAGKFYIAGDNKSEDVMVAGHATSQYGLFGGTTSFSDDDTLEVIDNGGGSYTITYRVDINGDKITATYTGTL